MMDPMVHITLFKQIYPEWSLYLCIGQTYKALVAKNVRTGELVAIGGPSFELIWPELIRQVGEAAHPQ